MIIGADLALNHGALVNSQGQIIYEYSTGKGNDSQVGDLYSIALEARSAIHRAIVDSLNIPKVGYSGLPHYKQLQGYTVAIDWDRNVGSWGAKFDGKGRRRGSTPITAILMTALINQFIAICVDRDNAEIHTVSPSMVRRCLTLGPRVSKDDVHKHCKNQGLLPKSIYPLRRSNQEVKGDIIDAYLLAITLECSKSYVDRKADF